jgi:hypothetical protein
MSNTRFIEIRSDELRSLIDSYMKIFCKKGKEITESRFAWYYTWIDRQNSKKGGGAEYPLVKIFTEDLTEIKEYIQVYGKPVKETKELTRHQKFLIELKAEARRYCNEYFTNPTDSDYLTIENAMIIGAGLQLKEFGSTPFC